MNAMQIISLWPTQIARAYHKFQIKRLINQRERDLQLTKRDIADSLELKRFLETDLLNLKRELRSM